MVAFRCSRGVLDAFAWRFHFCGVGRCLPGLLLSSLPLQPNPPVSFDTNKQPPAPQQEVNAPPAASQAPD
jgi:hypothetical protein